MTPVTICRACQSPGLEPVLSLGWLPLANRYVPTGESAELTYAPHEMLRCEKCGLAQLGISMPSDEVFDAGYPYRSSVTRQLRDNFADLAKEVGGIIELEERSLVLDIGGNDGNLLSNFSCRRLNVTPEDIGALGVARGIPWHQDYWRDVSARAVVGEHGPAAVITATNVFAHIEDPGAFLDAAKAALAPRGLLVLEVQYLPDLLRGVQCDHIYAEHQMWWHLEPLRELLARHDMTIIGARSIPTHGGSIRVYATRKGEERATDLDPAHRMFEDRVTSTDFELFAKATEQVRRDLRRVVGAIRAMGMRIVGIGAPSRASTLVSYCGLNADDLECVYEVAGSHKVGRYMPGTRIEIREEPAMFGDEQPDCALLLSHHVGLEMKKAWRAKGFKGRFIWPLPKVTID